MSQTKGSKSKMPVLFSHDQFSSGAQSCPALCDPKDCRMPGLPVHQQLPELAQTHVHLAGDAIQPSHYISSKENVHLSKSCSRFKAPSDAAFGLEPFPNPQASALFLAFPGGLSHSGSHICLRPSLVSCAQCGSQPVLT